MSAVLSRLFAAASVGSALALTTPALATVPEEFGAGARRIGMGGGGVAEVGDGFAALLNPAGLHQIRRPTAAAALSWGLIRLADPGAVWWDTNRDGLVNTDDPPLLLDDGADDTLGAHLAIGRHIGSKWGFGVGLYVPLQRLFRLETFEPALPTYLQLDNRLQRYVLAVGVGGEVLPGVAIGAGVDVVPRVRFTISLTADIVASADEEAEDLGEVVSDAVIDVHEIELDIIPGFAPTVGLQLDFGRWSPKLRGLRLGASWRGAVGVPIRGDLDIQANLAATDIGELDPFVLAGIVDAEMFLYDHYVPMRVDVGLSYAYEPYIRLFADLRWTRWSPMIPSIARVTDATLETPLISVGDVIRDGNAFQLDLRDTLSVRAGGEMDLPRVTLDGPARYVQTRLRAGVGWIPSPVRAQGPDSNFLDGDRLALSGGAGVEFWDPFKLTHGPIRVDAGVSYHRMLRRELLRASESPRPGYPVDADRFVIRGDAVMLTAGVSFDY